MTRPELLQGGPCVTVFHRGHIEIRGFDVRDRQQRKRRQFRNVDRLQIAAARSCTPRRGGPCAPRPARRSRTARRSLRSRCRRTSAVPMRSSRRSSAACDARRRPPPAPATIRTPDNSRGSRRASADCMLSSLFANNTRWSAWTNGLTASSAISHTRSGARPAMGRARTDGRLIARERGGQKRSGFDVPAGDGVSDVRCGIAGAAFSKRVTQPDERRLHHRDGQRDRFPAQRRDAARQLGRQILRRQRQARHSAAVDRPCAVRRRGSAAAAGARRPGSGPAGCRGWPATARSAVCRRSARFPAKTGT